MAASYFDYTRRIIPNFITFPVILWGLLSYGVFSGFDGLMFSLKGFGFGFVVLLIPYILKGIGGGDVKLMAAIGALKGYSFTLNSMLLGALIGGAMALGSILLSKNIMRNLNYSGVKLLFIPNYIIGNTISNISEFKSSGRKKAAIPYGVAISMGAVITLILMG